MSPHKNVTRHKTSPDTKHHHFVLLHTSVYSVLFKYIDLTPYIHNEYLRLNIKFTLVKGDYHWAILMFLGYEYYTLSW